MIVGEHERSDASAGTGSCRTPILQRGLGIDLNLRGVSPNDPATLIGADERQNFPVLTSADAAARSQGTLNSTPNTTFRLEFFANSVADPSGARRGRALPGQPRT